MIFIRGLWNGDRSWLFLLSISIWFGGFRNSHTQIEAMNMVCSTCNWSIPLHRPYELRILSTHPKPVCFTECWIQNSQQKFDINKEQGRIQFFRRWLRLFASREPIWAHTKIHRMKYRSHAHFVFKQNSFPFKSHFLTRCGGWKRQNIQVRRRISYSWIPRFAMHMSNITGTFYVETPSKFIRLYFSHSCMLSALLFVCVLFFLHIFLCPRFRLFVRTILLFDEWKRKRKRKMEYQLLLPKHLCIPGGNINFHIKKSLSNRKLCMERNTEYVYFDTQTHSQTTQNRFHANTSKWSQFFRLRICSNRYTFDQKSSGCCIAHTYTNIPYSTEHGWWQCGNSHSNDDDDVDDNGIYHFCVNGILK